jgi:6-phosphofructo-2-kinase/fructose-2,6-biphosphatase 4
MSPIPGLSSPAEPHERPPEKVINKAAEMVADKVADED